MNITLTDISKETAESIVEALRETIVEGNLTINELSAFPKVQQMLRQRAIELTGAMDQIARQITPWGAPAQHFDMRDADTRDSHDWETIR